MANGVRRTGTSVLLSLLFLSSTMLSMVAGTTPDDVNVDGDLGEWSADTLMGTDANGVSLHLTWNDTHLSFGWEGTDLSASEEGADLFVYLNTSEGGSALSSDWGFSHVLPFAADHAFVLEDSSYHAVMAHGASGWSTTYEENMATDVHTFPGDRYIGWSGNQITEVSLPWSAIGDPTQVDFVVWAQWQDAGHVWTAFPPQNPATSNGAETFTHLYHLPDRNVSTAPASMEVQTASVIEKVDDALNVAIVFHQHQPYYKNKLTGMYELPWVRVHAMTEYVDSPGILAQDPRHEGHLQPRALLPRAAHRLPPQRNG